MEAPVLRLSPSPHDSKNTSPATSVRGEEEMRRRSTSDPEPSFTSKQERFRKAAFVSTATQLGISIMTVFLETVWVQHAIHDDGRNALFHSVFSWILLVVAALIVIVSLLGIVGVWGRVPWVIKLSLLCWGTLAVLIEVVCAYTVISTVTGHCSDPRDCSSEVYSIVLPSVLGLLILLACCPLMYFEYRYAADLVKPERLLFDSDDEEEEDLSHGKQFL